MFKHLSPFVVATLLLASSSAASSIRGVDTKELTDKQSQFTCTISAFDEDTCKAAADDAGGACAWCSYNTFGFCVSSEQSEAIEESVPQVTCDDSSAAAQTMKEAVDDPFDTSCLAAAMGSDDAETVCGETNDQDGDTCVWCDIAGYGLCLNPDQVGAVEQFVPCNSNTNEAVEDPYDPSCLLAGMNSDDAESVCGETKDQDGEACVWCDIAGYGLCLNPDQVDAAGQFLTCNSNTLNEAVEDPYDTSCLVAAMGSDDAETVCGETNDQDGDACVWCDIAGYGLCLNPDQVDAVEQFVPCNSNTFNEAVEDPYDTSCLLAGMNSDDAESVCGETKDQDGEACVWCDIAGYGLCLNPDQVDAAGQFLTCNSNTLNEAVEDPYDTSCLVAAMGSDDAETVCGETNDQDGDACVWCDIAGYGLCLNPDQVDAVEQLVPCNSNTFNEAVEDPYDTSCLMAGMNSDEAESVCGETKDQDGEACVWCDVAGVYGLCLNPDQVDAAGQFLTCNSNTFNDAVEDPYDTSCLVAAMGSDDAETVCGETNDQDGDACVWCDIAGYGLCLNPDQVDAVEQFVPCNSNTFNEAVEDPYDTSCLLAGMNSDDAESVCGETKDQDGEACIWCDVAGVYGLCLNPDQADAAGQFLTCNSDNSAHFHAEQY